MDRRLLLWTLVVFFGAGIVFKLVNDATVGESVGVRLAFQVLTLAAIVVALMVVVRRRS